MREIWGVMELFCILIMMVVSQIYTCVKFIELCIKKSQFYYTFKKYNYFSLKKTEAERDIKQFSQGHMSCKRQNRDRTWS